MTQISARGSRATAGSMLSSLLLTTLLLVASPASAQQASFRQGAALGYIARDPAPAVSPLGYGYGHASPAPLREAPSVPRQEGSSAALDIGVVTELPILAGGQLTLELPLGFLLQGDLGVLPPGYVNAVDSALVSYGAYDQATSTIVRSGLADSLVARASAGIRPFSAHGLELLGGYTIATLGGGLSARAAVEAATGTSLPAELGDALIPVRSTVHSVHASIGWRWVLADHLVLRASLGYMQSVASKSRVELPDGAPKNATTEAAIASASRALDARLNDTYTTYVKMPMIGLSASYRF